jgi:hypothetical protein
VVVLLLLGMLVRYFATRTQSHAAQAPAASTGAPPAEKTQNGSDGSAASPADSLSSDASSPESRKLVLKIEAGKATGATVTADGQVVFAGTFIAGQSRTFQTDNEFDVAADDAGALLLQLNNQTLAPIGPPGQSGKVTLTRRNLKPSAGGND